MSEELTKLLNIRDQKKICKIIENLDVGYASLVSTLGGHKKGVEIEQLLLDNDLATGEIGSMIDRLKELFEC